MSLADKLPITKEARDYQLRIADELEQFLDTGSPCVLGMSTGGGKTYTTYLLLERYISKNPNFRVLILAHNQVILRKNFQDEGLLESFELVNKDQICTPKYASTNVVVAIPATIRQNYDKLGHFDMIVVDEAHDNFFAEMDQKIIKQYPNAKILALTATHGKFSGEYRGKLWHKVLFSVMEGLDAGVLADIAIEIVATNWDYTSEDFRNNELVGNYKFTKEHFLDACEKIDDRLRSVSGTNSKLYNAIKSLPSIKRRYPKTMIACHSKAMADYIYKFFRDKIGDQVEISYSGSDGDIDSAALIRFRDDNDCRMIVVVRRGILGYDCPKLEYMIDATGSRHVEKTSQSCGRVMRPDEETPNKIYLKIVPEAEVYYAEAQMAAVVALFHKENYANWTGKWLDVPVIEKPRESSVRELDSDGSGVKKILIPKLILNFSEYRTAFEQLTGKGNQPLQGVSFTTLRNVKLAMSGINPENNKKDIVKFFKENGRVPSVKNPKTANEKHLAQRFSHYTRPAGGCYDPIFVEEMKALGWFVGSSLLSKLKIKEFIALNGRLPSKSKQNPEEYKLRCLFNSYLYRSSKDYDPIFAEEIKNKGFYPKKYNINLNKQKIKDFFVLNGRLPSQKDKESCIRKLAHAARRYLSKTRRGSDLVFYKEMTKLGWKSISSLDSKKKIKDFFVLNGRLPSRSSPKEEERSMANKFTSYTVKSSLGYDPIFVEEMKALGWIKRKRKANI